MTSTLATHGIGAIKDSSSTFTITANGGSALIKPTSANSLTGWIHYTIPSPDATTPNLKTVYIDFSSQSATVEQVQIYLANNLVFSQGNLQRGQSFSLPITGNVGTVTYGGKGIAVSVYVSFENVASSLRFQSVSIDTA